MLNFEILNRFNKFFEVIVIIWINKISIECLQVKIKLNSYIDGENLLESKSFFSDQYANFIHKSTKAVDQLLGRILELNLDPNPDQD